MLLFFWKKSPWQVSELKSWAPHSCVKVHAQAHVLQHRTSKGRHCDAVWVGRRTLPQLYMLGCPVKYHSVNFLYFWYIPRLRVGNTRRATTTLSQYVLNYGTEQGRGNLDIWIWKFLSHSGQLSGTLGKMYLAYLITMIVAFPGDKLLRHSLILWKRSISRIFT